MNKPLAIYVSGPYREPILCTERALEVGQVLLDAGHAPFVPHFSHYWENGHQQNDYETWMRLDLAWVEKSDCLIRIPGPSRGADEEVNLAEELGIPVFYWVDALREDAEHADDRRVLEAFRAFAAAKFPEAPAAAVSPPPAIDAALAQMRAIFASKNADYAEGTWDSNFKDVAYQLGMDRETACDVLIAVKQARLRSLRTGNKMPSNEGIADTVLDRAVYALIALAMQNENGAFS